MLNRISTILLTACFYCVVSTNVLANTQLEALKTQILQQQQKLSQSQLDIDRLRQDLSQAQESQAPFRRTLTEKQRTLKAAEIQANQNPSSRTQAAVNNASFKLALAQRKFDKASRKAKSLETQIISLEQQQKNAQTNQARLEQQLQNKQRQVSQQAKRAAQARKARAKAKALKAKQQAKLKRQAQQQASKPSQKSPKAGKQLASLKAKTKQTVAAQAITLAPYSSNASDKATAKRLARHFKWLQKQKQKLAPNTQTVTIKDVTTKLDGKPSQQNISLSFHANENYAGSLKLQPGKHVLRLGNSKWKLDVPSNLAAATFYFIVDNHDPVLPDLHWYHSAM